MVDSPDNSKSNRKNKILYDKTDKSRFDDEDRKVQHKKNIEHKKQKQEIEEDEWQYWKNYYK